MTENNYLLIDEALALSKSTPRVAAEKRNIRDVVTTDGLNEEQTQAFEDLQKFVLSPDGGMHILLGFAGTGKTYMISRFIEWALATKQGKVALSAPTNKAVKILMKMAEYTNSRLDFSTIHRLLGLKEKKDKFGKIIFLQDANSIVSVGEYKILVVDEVSMLSDYLFNMLEPYASKGKLKLIFVGDPCQIPPIGEENCIPMDKHKRAHFKIGVSLLQQIVRQGLDNPIIQLSFNIRKDIHRQVPVYERQSQLVDGVGYIELSQGGDSFYFDKILEAYFCSDAFKANDDYAKVVAYRNETVNRINSKIRRMMYSDMEDYGKLVIGEKLVANSPIVEDNVILFTTNDTFEVVGFSTDDMLITDGVSIKYYKAKVAREKPDGTKDTEIIKIVHEDSDELHEQILDHLRKAAQAEVAGSYKASQNWKEYYEYMGIFADVKYNYCITAHKSQGSTYDNAIVMESDIMCNSNVYERNRIFYTACTRPRNILFIVN